MGKEDARNLSWAEEKGRCDPYLPEGGQEGELECEVEVLEEAESLENGHALVAMVVGAESTAKIISGPRISVLTQPNLGHLVPPLTTSEE